MQINNDTRLIDLTVGQLLSLINENTTPKKVTPSRKREYVYGIAGLMKIFNCSETTAHRIKSSGKINKAISQHGRTIVVDKELALELMKK